jgi:hypothetical protein
LPPPQLLLGYQQALFLHAQRKRACMLRRHSRFQAARAASAFWHAIRKQSTKFGKGKKYTGRMTLQVCASHKSLCDPRPRDFVIPRVAQTSIISGLYPRLHVSIGLRTASTRWFLSSTNSNTPLRMSLKCALVECRSRGTTF